MTQSSYTELLSGDLDDIKEILRDIIRKRDDDISDFDGLQGRFGIPEQADAVMVATDEIAFSDVSDENKRRKSTIQGILDLVPTSIPSGIVSPYAGTTAPTGYLLCYGQAVSRTTYADLFTVTSTTYGVGDGSTTFNLPDLRGRVVAGQDDMGGVSADRLTDQSGGVDGDVLGDTGGAETHALTEAQLAAHDHDYTMGINGFSSSSGIILGTNTSGSNTTQQVDSAGSGTAHNNVQPTIILNYIIKT